MSDTRIENGIEWFRVDEHNEECQCARCGSSCEYLPCWDCGDDLYTHHDCGEDSCACRYPEDNVLCDTCRGRGGRWHCISSPEYCNANPMPGRESVESTALNSQAWADVL
jgi:hypothetical protein